MRVCLCEIRPHLDLVVLRLRLLHLGSSLLLLLILLLLLFLFSDRLVCLRSCRHEESKLRHSSRSVRSLQHHRQGTASEAQNHAGTRRIWVLQILGSASGSHAQTQSKHGFVSATWAWCAVSRGSTPPPLGDLGPPKNHARQRFCDPTTPNCEGKLSCQTFQPEEPCSYSWKRWHFFCGDPTLPWILPWRNPGRNVV